MPCSQVSVQLYFTAHMLCYAHLPAGSTANPRPASAPSLPAPTTWFPRQCSRGPWRLSAGPCPCVGHNRGWPRHAVGRAWLRWPVAALECTVALGSGRRGQLHCVGAGSAGRNQVTWSTSRDVASVSPVARPPHTHRLQCAASAHRLLMPYFRCMASVPGLGPPAIVG